MKIPLQITFRNMDASDTVETAVRDGAEVLDTICDQIMRCRVVVESSHKRHSKGNLFHVSIDLTVPGKELVVSREPDEHHAHEDVYVAIRDAFNAIEKQLKKHMSRIRNDVKTHEPTPHGTVSELNAYEGYGRIDTSDGRDIYFHKNSLVKGDFDKLRVGTKVKFTEEQGDQGPQASMVKVVG